MHCDELPFDPPLNALESSDHGSSAVVEYSIKNYYGGIPAGSRPAPMLKGRGGADTCPSEAKATTSEKKRFIDGEPIKSGKWIKEAAAQSKAWSLD